jgi:uncharacterized surface protein with fasciclin (FAS1) repeats
MKTKIINPFAAMTLASFLMIGCAGSDQTTDATATEDTNMSETTTMAGNAPTAEKGSGLEVLVIKEEVVIPVGTVSVATLAIENPIPIDEMFEDIEDTEQLDVLALAKSSPNLSTFVKLIEHAKLEDDIQGQEHVTLFAFTNEAFGNMPKDRLDALAAADNTALLSALLQAHILTSDVSSTQLRGNNQIRMTDNSYIPVETGMNGTNISIGGSQIVKSDIEASNGRIHVVDSVILPSKAVQQD